METNVGAMLEQDQKLLELEEGADALQQGASQFEEQAEKPKRKFWFQNLKMRIVMGIIGLFIVAFIGFKFMKDDQQPPAYTYPSYPYPPPQQVVPPHAITGYA